MSFILDALRKSDARRRSEQGPTLVLDPTPARRVRHRRSSGIALALLLLVTGAVVFLTIRATPDNDLSAPQVSGEPAAVVRVSLTEAITAAVEPRPTPEVQAEVQPAVVPEQEQMHEQEPTPVAENPALERVSAEPIADEPAAVESTDVEPADYLMFWELPLAVRQDIPALTMNLHVFTADEAGRFVLINGQRRRQGERLPSGIEVVEIRPEGAILESKGYRFLLRR